MSRALEGEHYCKAHQGNHSHYDPHNCALCKAEARIAELERERDAIQFKLEGTQHDSKEAFANWRDFQKLASERRAENEALRTAIKSLAREADRNGRWICSKCGYIAAEVEIANPKYGPTHEGCNYHAAWVATIHAAELRALLEKTK